MPSVPGIQIQNRSATQSAQLKKVGDHLEFALKYDGVNLGLLAQIFEKVSQDELKQKLLNNSKELENSQYQIS
ncbi:MAG: hypothetical protein R6U68_12405 [Desulfobacteraceae bacterium]